MQENKVNVMDWSHPA